VLRTLLKYTDTDALKDALRLGHRGGLPADALAEVMALRAQTDEQQLREMVACHLPGVPPELFVRFGRAVAANRRDVVALVSLRHAVRRALRPYERMGGMEARMRYAGARVSHSRTLRPLLRGRARSNLRRKSPLAGGLTVAVLGPDGAGKTTIVDELRGWLAWRLNMSVLYMGSAQPSASTRLLKSTSKGIRAADRALAKLAGRAGGRSPLSALADLAMAVRYLGDAADRASRATSGQRLASRGAVVVFDRYPLPGVTLEDRMVDGPRIAQLGANSTKGLLGRLRRREEAMYRSIPPPDHVILLSLPVEVALSRKANRAPEAVAAKRQALAQADLASDGLSVISVDASRPTDEVMRDVKAELWQRL
jgi:thymidylate kinase